MNRLNWGVLLLLGGTAFSVLGAARCGDDDNDGDTDADAGTDTDTDTDMDTDTDTDTDTDSDTDSDTGTDTDSETEAIESWTDSSSGLMWQVSPPDEEMTWEEAIAYCAGLSDGGWHLPTISELRTLIRGCDETITGGSCDVTDSCSSIESCHNACDGCSCNSGPNGGCYGPPSGPDGAFFDNDCEHRWSSSPVTDGSDGWGVMFDCGWVSYPNSDGNSKYVRCVRD